jgi:hypothetical protein
MLIRRRLRTVLRRIFGRTDGALTQDGASDDYILKADEHSVWIAVGEISVYIKREDEGVTVDLYPLAAEMEESLAACWALYADARGAKEGIENGESGKA